mgnify:CR=1 FL=1
MGRQLFATGALLSPSKLTLRPLGEAAAGGTSGEASRNTNGGAGAGAGDASGGRRRRRRSSQVHANLAAPAKTLVTRKSFMPRRRRKGSTTLSALDHTACVRLALGWGWGWGWG